MTSIPKQNLERMTLTPEQSLERMTLAAHHFYLEAVRTDCHAFLELTGIMNEYIEACKAALAQGIDFREVNGHHSQRMHLESYQLDYFNEKLNCIFQGCLGIQAVINPDEVQK
jgi:hypothetical protein